VNKGKKPAVVGAKLVLEEAFSTLRSFLSSKNFGTIHREQSTDLNDYEYMSKGCM
jgi:hypothetical protein